MRRIAVGIATALVCSSAGATYAASGNSSQTSGAIVLEGNHSASIEVTLPSAPAVNDLFHIDAVAHGHYAGYLLSDPHGHPLVGSMLLHGVGLGPHDGIPIALPFTPLKAGRYIVTLVADGPAVVRIPLTAGGHAVLRPTRPTHVFTHLSRTDAMTVSATGTSVAYGSTPVAAGKHVLAAVTMFTHSTDNVVGDEDICFTTSSICEMGDQGGGNWDYTYPENLGETTSFQGTTEYPVVFPAGTHAHTDGAGSGLHATHQMFVLVLG